MDWSRVRMPPKPHQIEGTNKLIAEPAFALFDEVGAGKSKQVIDAAFWLHSLGIINAVLVIAPGSARSVWADPDPVLGEVAKHAWDEPYEVKEYHRKTKSGEQPRTLFRGLKFFVTNYEFIRREERLEPLLEWVKKHKVLLVLDESWMVQNKSQQMKACHKLRQSCARVVLLNGTPGDPKAIYYQFAILGQHILGFKNFFTFRARHAVMGGWQNKAIVAWQNMDEFNAKTAPYAVRRLTRDCFDLGDEPNRTQIEVKLTPATWNLYKQMRDELVAWLSTAEASIAGQAGVKVIRLAQLTAGFLGGVENLSGQPDLDTVTDAGAREIGREKVDAVIEWMEQNGPVHKEVIWSVYRQSVEQVAREMQRCYPTHQIAKIYGDQTPEEREEAKRLLAPGGTPAPAIVVGNVQSGGAGLNFAAANIAIYLTNSFSLKDRKQSEGRLDRPGQTQRVTFLDVIATGPDGQKTIDHHIVRSLRKKEDLANYTAAAWRRVLTEE